MAENTAPKEKKTDRAVRRYCLCRGMFSINRVPSVGMLPLENEAANKTPRACLQDGRSPYSSSEEEKTDA